MQNIYHLYLDESGTRHPDKKQGRKPGHNYDWFSIGGVLVLKADEDKIKDSIKKFNTKWEITAPLHSVEIRAKSKKFSFIGKLEETRQKEFYEDLYQLLAEIPVIGIACVIDRPGYNHRYEEKYGRQRWSLCKTAYPVVIERAAKFAKERNTKLRVFIEKSDKKTDVKMKEYYDELRKNGMPFGSAPSAKYQPLTQKDLENTLYEFKTKTKQSLITQIADLYLWPICMGGYNKANTPYSRLKADNKLIDCFLSAEEIESCGIKYSCWDLVSS